MEEDVEDEDVEEEGEEVVEEVEAAAEAKNTAVIASSSSCCAAISWALGISIPYFFSSAVFPAKYLTPFETAVIPIPASFWKSVISGVAAVRLEAAADDVVQAAAIEYFVASAAGVSVVVEAFVPDASVGGQNPYASAISLPAGCSVVSAAAAATGAVLYASAIALPAGCSERLSIAPSMAELLSLSVSDQKAWTT